MNAKVDQELCIGCGLCASMAPEVFVMNDDGKAEACEGANVDATAQEAADSCPVSAIVIE